MISPRAEDPPEPVVDRDASRRRHAELYDSEYAKQLRRVARIREAIDGEEPSVRALRARSEDVPEADDAAAAVALVGPAPNEADVAELATFAPLPPPDEPARESDALELLPTPLALEDLDRRPSPIPPRLFGSWYPPSPEEPVVPTRRRPRLRIVIAATLALASGAALVSQLLGVPEHRVAPRLVRLASPATDLAAADGRLWVTSPQAGIVAQLDAGTGRPVDPTVQLDGTPARIAVAGGAAWAADTANAAVVLLRDGKALPAVPVGPDIADVAVADGAVWIAGTADGMVRVLDPGALRPIEIAVGGHPVALAADARSVVVADAGGALARLDVGTRRMSGSVRIGGTPVDVALAGGAAWVADARAGTVRSVSAAGGIAAAIAVGREPVAVAADGADVYVVCRGDRALVRLDARSGMVLRRFRLDVEPAALTVDARHVWIAAADTSAVLRLDRRSLE